MNKCRVRVEMKKLPLNASRQDRERSLSILLRILKRACNDYGIPHSLKEHEFFQRKCDLRRRKKQQARLMARLGGNLENQQEGDY